MQISCCPICSLPRSETLNIEEVRMSFDIYECCGCEYGCDDTSAYREEWLKKGAPWFRKRECPLEWNLEEQLKNIIPNWDTLQFDWKTVFPQND